MHGIVFGVRGGGNSLGEDQGVRTLDAIVADVQLVVRNVVEDERRHY